MRSWLKDIDTCIQEHKLSNLGTVKLIKDYMIDHTKGAVECYLYNNSM